MASFRPLFLCLAFLSVATICYSEELVCLTSGFCFHADSYIENHGNSVLRVGSGTMEFPSRDIAEVRTIEAAPSAALQPATPAPSSENAQTWLSKAAEAQGLDLNFLRSVAKIESDFKQDAVSSKGAIGLMQLLPSTARGLAVDPKIANENALGGAKYLRALLLRYHNNSALALAAYNAGPGAVSRFGGVPPFDETLQYVRRVTREYDRLQAINLKAKITTSAANRPSARD